MAQTIKLKRSATQNAVPSTSQLELGEVAINTYDGKMYIKKNDGSDSIVEIGGDATSSSGLDFTGNLNLADDVRIVIGDGNDLQIWHGGVDSYIRNDFGHLQLIQGADDKDIQFYCDDGAGGTTQYMAIDGGEGRIVFNKWTRHVDGARILVGTGGDLAIYHDGSHSNILDQGTGNLRIAGSIVEIAKNDFTETMAKFTEDGASELYYNGGKKFETTSTGATVTGTLVADGLDLGDDNILNVGTIAVDKVKGDADDNTNITFAGNDITAFYQGGAEKIRIDADGRLLVNTTSSIDNLSQLHIVGPTSGRAGITLQDGDSTTQKTFFTQDGGVTRFNTQNDTSHGSFVVGGWNGTSSVDLLRVTGDGRVGIGTNAPAKELHIASSQPDILLQDTDGTNQTSEITSSGGNLFLGSRNDTANGAIVFRGLGGGTGDEYARFNDGGNLLVGATAYAGNSSSVTGSGLSDGYMWASRSANAAAIFNRLSTDGDVVLIRKNGATVGAIQTKTSDLAIGTGDTGIRFVDGDDAILPHSITANDYVNAAIGLGTSNYKFTDIHLSGQVNTGTISSGTITSSGVVNAGTHFNVNSSGNLLKVDISAWDSTGNNDQAILWNGYNSTIGDHIVLKAAGNGTTHGAIVVADGVFSYGSTTSAVSTSASLTAPLSSGTAFTVTSGGNAAFAGTLSSSGTGTSSFAGPLTVGGTTLGNAFEFQVNGDTRITGFLEAGTAQLGNTTLTGFLRGPTTFTIDPAAHGDNTGTVVIAGNLQVDGTTTTINSTTLTVDDKNITLASGSTNAAAANGAGITVDCGSDTDATWTYSSGDDAWKSNKHILAYTGGGTGLFAVGRDANQAIQIDISDNYNKITAHQDADENGDHFFDLIRDFDGTGKADFRIMNQSSVHMLIDKDGKVGINTTSPDTKLDIDGLVNGGIAFTATQVEIDRQSLLPNGRIFYNDSRLIYDSPANGHRFAVAGNQGSNLALEIYSNRDIGFYNSSGAADLFWDASTSRLGIGTTSPSHPLHISESVNDTTLLGLSYSSSDSGAADYAHYGELLIQGGGTYNKAGIRGYANAYQTGNAALAFWTQEHGGSYAERMRIMGDGKVGIGTTAPDTSLHVFSSGTTQAKFVRDLTTDVGLTIGNDSSGVVFGTIGVHNYQFYANGARRLNISSTGAATFNEAFTLPTSDGSANQVLKTDGSGNVTWANEAAVSANTSISDADGDTKIQVEESADEDVIRFDTAGSQRMVIDSGGNFGFGVNSPVSYFHVYKSSTGVIARIEGTSGRYLYTGTDSLGHYLEQVGTSSTDRVLRIQNSNGSGQYTQLLFDGHNQRIYTNGAAKVGIGTSSLTNQFHVSGDARIEGNLMAGSSAASNIPARPLHVKSTGDNAALRIEDSTSSNTVFDFRVTHGEGLRFINVTGGITPLFVGTNGNVGIGTTSPDQKLEVSGDGHLIRATGTTSGGSARIGVYNENDGSGNAGATVYMESSGWGEGFLYVGAHNLSATGGDFNIRAGSGLDLTFGNGTTEYARISGSGNFGIGTTTPSRKLDISAAGNDGIRIASANALIGGGASGGDTQLIYWNGSNAYYGRNALGGSVSQHEFRTGGATRLTIASSGNVGVGTASPDAKLQVAYNGGHTSGNISLTHSSLDIYNPLQANTDEKGAILTFSDHYQDANGYPRTVRAAIKGGTDTVGNTADGFLAFYTDSGSANSATERMRITKDGRLGIGTASPSQALQVDSGNVRINHPDLGGSPAMTATLEMYGYEGRGVGLKLRDQQNSASGSSNREWFVGTGYAQSNFNIGYSATGSQSSYAANNKLTITTSGNVGIGTTTPAKTLDVAANGSSQGIHLNISGVGRLQMYADGDRNYFKGLSGNGHRFTTTGGANVEILNNGNVGIGSTAPQNVLDLGNGTNGRGIAWGGSGGTAHYNTIWSEYSSASIIIGAGLKGATDSSTFLNPFTGTYGYAAIELDTFSDDGIKFYTGADSSRTKDAAITPTERMRLTNAGRLGIGTTAPTSNLHVKTSVDNSVSQGIVVERSLNSDRGYINYSGGAFQFRSTVGDPIVFGETDAEHLRILPDGNIGMGSTSVSSALSGSNRTFKIEDDDGADIRFVHTGGVDFTVGVTNSNTSYVWNAGSHNILFGTAGTERMRLNSAGDLLIGKNSTGAGTAGIALLQQDIITTTRSGGYSLLANRLSSYGEIIRIQQASTTVGAIGSGDGNSIYIECPVSTKVGLDFRSDILPRLGGALSNGGVDLGAPSYRFRSIELSAAVNVGHASIQTDSTTTSATTQVAIDAFVASEFRSAEFTIQVTNSTDSTYHLTKVLLIHDGTTPGITEYGTVFTGSAAEATFDADISSGNVRLLATPASTDSMTFKVVRHCITV